MVSKTQENKDAQGYTKKPMQCNNCKNYTSEKIVNPKIWSGGEDYITEKNKRCGLGGFTVQSSASCKLYTGS